VSNLSPVLDLRALQTWFLSVLTHPGSDPEAVHAHADRVPPGQLDRVLSHGPCLSNWERLHIYRHAYVARLVECLQDDFGAVANAVESERFEALCRKYIEQFPSRQPNLNVFGAQFPRFLRHQDAPWAEFASDLAQLEWALVEVVHEPCDDVLSAATLQGVGPEALPLLRFERNRASRFLQFTYPVNEYLGAWLQDRAPALPQPRPNSALVVRRGKRVTRLQLEERQGLILGRLLAGACLLEALEGVQVTPNELHSWFGTWTELGVFAEPRRDA
jgi:hypothetical protein